MAGESEYKYEAYITWVSDSGTALELRKFNGKLLGTYPSSDILPAEDERWILKPHVSRFQFEEST